jgi:nucleotide-binding universal stress UspA family protein
MIAIRTILCPVDFSQATAPQLALASDLCRAFNARLILHHNLTAMAIGAAVGWMYAADHPSLSEESAEQRLAGLAEAQTDVDVEIKVTRGPASASVLAVSEVVAADVVVLSAHNIPAEEHASVTELVLGSGERSVLTVHDHGADRHALSIQPSAGTRQVTLAPTDLTAESRAAVDFAFELSRKLPLEIHLLHLIGQRLRMGNRSQAVAEAERHLRALIPSDCTEWAAVHVSVGDPVEGILHWANDLSAACVVMGEHTRVPLRRWFSKDTSRAVLYKTPCPVWYVPGQRADAAPLSKDVTGG